MQFEELPEKDREVVENLKFGSATIECDIKDALEDAKNIRDFKIGVSQKMENLIAEAEAVRDEIGCTSDIVHVVIHLHRGVIFNTAVFGDKEKAKQYRDEQVKEQYGEPVERQEGDDYIDLQECQVIV